MDGRAFHVREAAAHGLSAERVRARDLTTPFRGIRRPIGVDWSFLDTCAAYALRMPPAQVFSHVTAARLHGLPLPARFRDATDLHVSARTPSRAPRLRGVVGHTARADIAVTTIRGLRVTSAVETWMSLAETLDLDGLIVAGDALVGRREPLATLREIDDSLVRSRGRRGQRLRVAARQEMRAGVDSPRETELRLLVTRAGLPEPVVNQRHYGAGGEYLGRGDLAYPEWKVLVEYDGSHHYLDEAQGHIDVERLARFADDDWAIVRINRSNIRLPGFVVTKVMAALHRKGWPGQRS